MSKCLNCDKNLKQTTGPGREKKYCDDACRLQHWKKNHEKRKVVLTEDENGQWTDQDGKKVKFEWVAGARVNVLSKTISSKWEIGVDPYQNGKKTPGKATVIKKKDLKIGYPKTKKMSVKESAKVMKDLLDPVKLKEKYRRLNEMEEKSPIGSAAMPPKSRPEAEIKRSGAKPALSPYLQQRQKMKQGGK